SKKLSLDGRTAVEQFEACRAEIVGQSEILSQVVREELLPGLAAQGIPILDYEDVSSSEQQQLREYFSESVQPILTPLVVDAAHPFPFISHDVLNLGVMIAAKKGAKKRFVRIRVPDNRPRWVPVNEGAGFVPLEQVIAANLDLVFPSNPTAPAHVFRVTRGAEGERNQTAELTEEELEAPGSIVRQVSEELKARRFAGVVRLQVSSDMPEKMVAWISKQLGISEEDVYPTERLLGVDDLVALDTGDREDLMLPEHEPVTPPRLRRLPQNDPDAIFREIRRGDILLHHPYDSFDGSVLRFLESAAVDPGVLAIKLTIYRTSKGSPIIQALAEAARRGKQVAVLVEITARFDEAPNIAWGQFLEKEGVHVAYGVEKLKTHVKLALVVREEKGHIRRYAHVGTGNYHAGTARIYEDMGILTCHREICDDVSAVFNQLTAAINPPGYKRMLVAPYTMRDRFTELIRREAEHARAGREAGIRAKMNQLQDPEIIEELYKASQAGVPIELCVRGLCCLRPGVPGLSGTIRLHSVIGRFLEHSRIYRFANGGDPECFLGSADWMHRNLTNRVETIIPVLDEKVKAQLDGILDVYADDNCSAWDCGPDSVYTLRSPAPGEKRRAVQDILIQRKRDGTQKRAKKARSKRKELPVPVDEL
ncbi:MAG: polyphosphate kinase 1, partial [Deltaproteobacteria bacterium]|nr:polyphosphate kinase 1 [Deltaproteobacteria bacterium]